MKIPKKYHGMWVARKGEKILFAEKNYEKAAKKVGKASDVILTMFPKSGYFIGRT